MKLSNLNSKIEEQQSVVDQAKKESLDFRNENLQGMDVASFKQKFLYPELKVLDNKKEKKDEHQTIAVGILFLIFSVAGIIISLTMLDGPTFVCDDNSAELEWYDVLDETEDCEDGSDERTSSFWGSDDDTRAEKFDSSAELNVHILTMTGFCCSMGLLGAAIPLAVMKVSDNPKVIFESEFDREHGKHFAESESLHKNHIKENSKLRGLVTRSSNLTNNYQEHINKNKELLNSRKKKENLESELDKIKISISETQQNIEDNWSSISDLVPYGKNLL